MPKQKDLKRVVRTRMHKTGESYTAARAQVLRKVPEPASTYAEIGGKSDAILREKTGRDWAGWVRALDALKASEKPHGEIARSVASMGASSWWSQTVTVGYERIRGLRDKGQRRGGSYVIGKSRTFGVPVSKLFDAFAKPRLRSRWLPGAVTVRGATPRKSIRLDLADGTRVEIGFTVKGTAKSTVAIAHSKLADRATAEQRKTWWAERLDALAGVLS